MAVAANEANNPKNRNIRIKFNQLIAVGIKNRSCAPNIISPPTVCQNAIINNSFFREISFAMLPKRTMVTAKTIAPRKEKTSPISSLKAVVKIPVRSAIPANAVGNEIYIFHEGFFLYMIHAKNGTNTVFKQVMKALLDGVECLLPIVWKKNPKKLSIPMIDPQRISLRVNVTMPRPKKATATIKKIAPLKNIMPAGSKPSSEANLSTIKYEPYIKAVSKINKFAFFFVMLIRI